MKIKWPVNHPRSRTKPSAVAAAKRHRAMLAERDRYALEREWLRKKSRNPKVKR